MPTAPAPQPTAKRTKRPPLAMRSPLYRARNTNGGNFLPGIDGRSHQARRMYDIAALVARDLGGADKLTETRLSLIRRFSSLSVLLEQQEVQIASGKEIDLASYSQLSSTLVRLAARIGLKRVPKNVTPVRSEYLDGSNGNEPA